MKTIKRQKFESEIVLNNKTYYWNPISSAQNKPFPNDVLKVELLNKALKGKTDLHGKPYKPSVFFYSLTKQV